MDAKRMKRRRLKISCQGGRPQTVGDYLITVRRRKRGDSYTVTIEPLVLTADKTEAKIPASQ